MSVAEARLNSFDQGEIAHGLKGVKDGAVDVRYETPFS